MPAIARTARSYSSLRCGIRSLEAQRPACLPSQPMSQCATTARSTMTI